MTNPTIDLKRDSERRFSHLFKHLPVCIIVTDLTVTPEIILEVNHRTELVYGYTEFELVRNPITNLVPEESRAFVQNIIVRVKQGETVTTETTNQRRDCSIFPVRIISTLDPINRDRMITAVEDITSEKQRRSETEAIEAERLRIAHEIHDGVAQSLAGLRFKLALWQHMAADAPPAMRQALDEMQDILNAAIIDLRRAIFDLRPVDLETMGFFPALNQLVCGFGDQTEVCAALEISEPPPTLPAVYELPLFRIIQESLNNIAQHAQASSALARLSVDPAGWIVVSLRDNGCGFDPSQIGSKNMVGHFGLRQMRERLLDLGGTLEIHSEAGLGTELLITLPPITR